MIERILFLDIDGPLIPSRAYVLANQTKPYVTKFDQCAVGMINSACQKTNRKIVLHSSWIRTKFITRDDLCGMDVKEWCISEGIKEELFHPTDPYCDRDTSYRYDRVDLWLAKHKEVTDFVILDDEAPDPFYPFYKQWLQIDFDEGLTWKKFNQLKDGNWKLKTPATS